MRRSVSVLVILVLVLIVSVPADTFGCYRCRYSPSNFGFCRPGFDRGHGQCSEYVADPWTGRTNCDTAPSWNCYNGGTLITEGPGDPPGIGDEEDPVLNGANQPCSWTDVDVLRLV